MTSYFNKMYNKAQTEEAQDSIRDEQIEWYEDFKDSYLQIKK
jgi:hypothetical protein